MMSSKGGAPVGNSGEVESAVQRVENYWNLIAERSIPDRSILDLRGGEATPVHIFANWKTGELRFFASHIVKRLGIDHFLEQLQNETRLSTKESSPPNQTGEQTPTVS